MELDPSTPDEFVESQPSAPLTGGESLKATDPHALEPEIDDGMPDSKESGVDDASGGGPAETSGRRKDDDDREDDDEGGAIEVVPVKLELDPDPRAGLDSAVDDASSKAPIVESAAGAEPFPAPGAPRTEFRVEEARQRPDDQRAEPDVQRPASISSGSKRVGISVAAVVAAVIAVVAGLALFGGGADSPEVAATDPSPSAPADQPAVSDPPTEPSPEPTETEQPAFELTEMPSLVICNDGTSFSGIEQPDGTFTDPDTGEVLSCS